ncbi:bifunctional oligoribonuclease/PAP phosphatase NrnA [Halodesulfovibrio sp.]|jgi:phosphoesterase RecJ-like protein|uniref:DHH family phosphoesterase n=1 Tax=Halodesulfovibrio sp. TaxID=1912772 RepID=UPI0025DE2B58|nr:bifunctional oligoribonuclease/PAP phosphatase NrnA [Halodesulfovibrio sp.]MCT4536386.1 bifunctional oligoribonuclease/PAP phosphatase NrnA [Halodesulfovibrio sp.]MCT4625561.1 bifunctional oligoribonuclease/PAP phosphatase NrnA [Halodesulfovibrio sp.]
MSNVLSEIAQTIRAGETFLLTAHISPDGDAVGSVAAMAWLLTKLEKTPVIFLESGIPNYLEWVEFPCSVFTTAEELATCTPDTIIVMDCGEAERAGNIVTDYLAHTDAPVINLDHHLHNPMFGSINLVDTTASSTGELVADIAEELTIGFDGFLGESLYLAISSDTGRFSYNNTTARAHAVASKVVDAGLKAGDFNEKLDSEWSLNKIRLWAELFTNIEIALNGKVAYLTLPDALFERTETEYSDIESIINYLRKIENVDVAMTVRETDTGSKASLRSHGAVDVQKMAATLGGGGHKNAAGVSLDLPLDAAVETLLATIAQNLVLNEA